MMLLESELIEILQLEKNRSETYLGDKIWETF